MNALAKGSIALFLATSGQFLMTRYLPDLGRRIDLFTVVVIYYAVTRRRMGVMLAGTSAGLVQDLLTHTFLGMNAFKKTLVGYVMGALGSVFMLNQPLPRFGILFVATVLETLVEAGLILVLGQHATLPSAGELVRQGLGNGITGSLIYWVVSKLD